MKALTMRLKFCVLCGQTDPKTLEHHHIIPKIRGGIDDETHILTLCGTCHGLFHDYLRPISIGTLSLEGKIISNQRPIEEKKADLEHRLNVLQGELDILDTREKWYEELKLQKVMVRTDETITVPVNPVSETICLQQEEEINPVSETICLQQEEEMPRLRPVKITTKDEDEDPKNPPTIDTRNKDGYWGPLLTQEQFHCATLGTKK